MFATRSIFVLQGLLSENEHLPKYRRDLVAKLKVLRAELTALQPQSGHCRLEVSRTEVFEESYRYLLVCYYNVWFVYMGFLPQTYYENAP